MAGPDDRDALWVAIEEYAATREALGQARGLGGDPAGAGWGVRTARGELRRLLGPPPLPADFQVVPPPERWRDRPGPWITAPPPIGSRREGRPTATRVRVAPAAGTSPDAVEAAINAALARVEQDGHAVPSVQVAPGCSGASSRTRA